MDDLRYKTYKQVDRIIQSNCEGCRYNLPSQLDHTYCFTTTYSPDLIREAIHQLRETDQITEKEFKLLKENYKELL